MKRYIISLTWISFIVLLTINSVGIPNQPSPSNYQDEEEVQYLIISDEIFIAHLIPLKNFRIQQGITTAIYSTSEIGHTVEEIKNFINNAFYSWTEPPTAVFLVGDIELIPAPVWENYCLSDNIYGDVNNDDLPEIVIGRLPVNTTDELEQYIHRIINFENNPPSDPHYYDFPLAVANFENASSSSWMISEIFNGWYESGMEKNPVREYAGSVAPQNWPDEALYLAFGPQGLNYIPASPAYLAGFSGGSASGINNALNAGAMSLFSFTQGNVNGWYSPDYVIENMGGLNSALPTLLISMNSLTGSFGFSGGNCFAEAFLKHPYGGTGVIAPSEIVYSSGSEWFSIGLIDGLWDDFLPGAQNFHSSQFSFPSEALVSAKYFLSKMAFLINPVVRKSFYHLYNFLGEPFVPFNDRVTENLAVFHDSVICAGQTDFQVQADSGALISLVIKNEISVVEFATGVFQILPLPPLVIGDTLHLTITGSRFRRYHAEISCLYPNKLDNASFDKISISPNPASEYLHINFGSTVHLTSIPSIFNTMGQEIQLINYQFSKEIQMMEIQLSEIENGFYILQLWVENKLLTYKFEVRK